MRRLRGLLIHKILKPSVAAMRSASCLRDLLIHKILKQEGKITRWRWGLRGLLIRKILKQSRVDFHVQCPV